MKTISRAILIVLAGAVIGGAVNHKMVLAAFNDDQSVRPGCQKKFSENPFEDFRIPGSISGVESPKTR